jgi:hypothetical protein
MWGELQRFQSKLQVGELIHLYLNLLQVVLQMLRQLQLIHLMIHLECELNPTG